MDIHAVLLIPEDGDPLGLLAEGPCGARPPMAWQCTCSPRWRPCSPNKYSCADCHSQGFPGRALPLVWDGEPAAEGMDRLGRLWPQMTTSLIEHIVAGAVDPGRVVPFVWDVPLCHVVLLDSEGREVKP
jgi:hypothetical protein